MSLQNLLSGPPAIVAAGVDVFSEALRAQGADVHDVDWRPPGFGDPADLAALALDPRRAAANRTAVERLMAAGSVLVDVRPAREVIGLTDRTLLHSGPPLEWENASGPMRGALVGACLFEGWAADVEEAEILLATGAVTLDPCHHHRTVGPMAGVTSPSMWMWCLEDPVTGGQAFCNLNEGLGKVLRMGAFNEEVQARLRWMRDVLGPVLSKAVRGSIDAGNDPLDVKAVLAQMLQMGDEAHNRNRAGSLMALRELSPAIVASGAPSSDIADVLRFIGGNEHFFLNLGMPTAKLALDAARGIPGSTMLTVMSRNGTEFGIQTSGTGDRWFTGPANTPVGLFLGDYGPDDANPDIGDSAIMETYGIGGFAMAAAPAIVRFVGGTVPDALATTERMYQLTLAENPAMQIPIMGFRGSPTGIDVLKVARTGWLPQINTGMAGRVAGTGQVGAGLVQPPQQCFEQALAALAEEARTA
ncbi:DUF1116 domain-containing protein [Blastococcus sp. MG754426]|uniref:DUF1116 domain-containing protein n=1 Tax=unclassified Blastococcus TaxID=2619396 RepID=UPI001EF0B92C|nr:MULTISPECIES: DUF1116 domain-containing protein [unclassified Blastococcus]MCF6507924.1 DUF1116 domain-containing protein [Blastococcus sp. MG754426]MCF6512506.1 DUF1116 domain-containing protein [Blastococcus sp. MG754427]